VIKFHYTSLDRHILVDSTGVLQCEVRAATPERRPRALGWYYLDVGANDPDVAALARCIDTVELVEREPSMPGPPAPAYSPPHYFAIESGSRQARIPIDGDHPLPAELVAALAPLFARLEQAPLRTLELVVELARETVAVGELVRVDFQFRSRGRFPAEIRRLTTDPRGDGARLWLELAPLERSDRVAFTFHVPAESLPASERLLRIEPDACVRCAAQLVPELRPGAYFVCARYYAPPAVSEERQAHPHLVAGEARVDVGTLTIKP
jgi:hypothetical protein